MPDSRFIFNDEDTINSYGFRIPTKGIKLNRFEKNPVMLDMHWNDTSSVMGKWEDVKNENGILSGIPVFDVEDEKALKLKGKVDRGFVNSCSMGVRFKRENLVLVGEELVLKECELYEVSIVAVPSNQNSIRLYAEGANQPLSDDEATNLCLSISQNDNLKTDINMKFKLTDAAALALGFTAGTEVDATEISANVERLQVSLTSTEGKLTAANNEIASLKNAQETAKLSGITAKVDKAVTEGKINADKKQAFIDLGVANESLLDSTLEALTGKTSLAAQVFNMQGATDVKTADDFQKLSLAEQMEFKKSRPQDYQKIFKI